METRKWGTGELPNSEIILIWTLAPWSRRTMSSLIIVEYIDSSFPSKCYECPASRLVLGRLASTEALPRGCGISEHGNIDIVVNQVARIAGPNQSLVSTPPRSHSRPEIPWANIPPSSQTSKFHRSHRPRFPTSGQKCRIPLHRAG